jgi:hypothetical protein
LARSADRVKRESRKGQPAKWLTPLTIALKFSER